MAQVSVGINKIKFQIEPKTSPGISPSNKVTAKELIQENRTKSQNSDRLAVPW
jgi:hypothetical protein